VAAINYSPEAAGNLVRSLSGALCTNSGKDIRPPFGISTHFIGITTEHIYMKSNNRSEHYNSSDEFNSDLYGPEHVA
jgi:hypothetical protein